MCTELTVKLGLRTIVLLVPFPNTWNYVIEALSHWEDIPVDQWTVLFGSQRIIHDPTASDGQYVQFQVFNPVVHTVVGYRRST